MFALRNSGALKRLGPEARFLSTWILVAAGMLAACLFGIVTRPAGLLATVWPANALMLGLLLKMPPDRRAPVWLASPVAFMAADLMVGTGWAKALLLNAANLGGVAAAYAATRSIPQNALKMQEPQSALWLILVAAAGATAAGLVAAASDPLLLGIGRFDEWAFWFASELVNYIALLPLILSMPPMRRPVSVSPLASVSDWRSLLPVATLIGICALTVLAGNSEATAFAVPALIWCGLAYSVFAVSVLTFAFASWSLFNIGMGHLHDPSGFYGDGAIVSLRLAVFMVALAPVTLSIVMRNRNELVQKLSVARQRADMALEAGGIVGIWDLDVATHTIAIEATDPYSHGLSFSREWSIERALDNIHPDDRKRVRDELNASIATGTDLHCRYEDVALEGSSRWFAAVGKPVFDHRHAVTHLIGVFINLTEQMEAAEALELSDKRFNIVIESIPDIVWSADGNGLHDYFNQRWREFTGIEPGDIEPETWVDLIHPEDRRRVMETWAACLKTGRDYSIDYRFKYHDGSYRWLKVQAKPLRNAQDIIVRWYGTATDIDEAKQFEAEREAVAGELDHRIGNLFALVNSLVNLSAREGDTVQAVADAIRSRLKALHDAHGLIKRANVSGTTSMAALLRTLLRPYDDGSGKILVSGDDVQVAAAAVTPVALVFHELATNAAKYGALRGHGGALSVTLIRRDGCLTIDWKEKCLSPAPVSDGTGFGSKLFKAIIEGQLRGTAARSSTPEGLAVDLSFPVASLARTPV